MQEGARRRLHFRGGHLFRDGWFLSGMRHGPQVGQGFFRSTITLRRILLGQPLNDMGQVVRHRKHPFRGVIFDVDPEFANTEEWYQAIPEDSRPSKDQPFYHLLAENDQSYYVAYVSEQNLVADYSGQPVDHPDLPDLFGDFEDGHYPLHVQLN